MGGWRKGTVAILWSVVVLGVGYWLEAEYGLADMSWGTLVIAALIGIAVLYTREIRPAVLWARGKLAKDKDETERQRKQAELERRFDENPGNGRIAAKLIAAMPDPTSGERILNAFNDAEPKRARYCPVCAYASLLLTHGDELGALAAVNEVMMEVGFYERGAEFDAAFEEFFVDAGEHDSDALDRISKAEEDRRGGR